MARERKAIEGFGSRAHTHVWRESGDVANHGKARQGKGGRASDTFIRLQGLVETLATACSGSLLLGDGGGIELLLCFQPGLVALRGLFIRAATHKA